MQQIRTLMAVVTCVFAVAGCSTASDQSVTSQKNQFYFNGGPESPTISYTYSGNYSITSGQPWGGAENCGPTSTTTCEVVVTAGRSGSTPVAQWFTQNAPAADCTTDCGGSQPQKLNFAITGTLSVNGVDYPLALGQGSADGAGLDNWWFGGPGWTRQQVCGTTAVVTPDGKWYVTDSPGQGGSSGDEFYWAFVYNVTTCQ